MTESYQAASAGPSDAMTVGELRQFLDGVPEHLPVHGFWELITPPVKAACITPKGVYLDCDDFSHDRDSFLSSCE